LEIEEDTGLKAVPAGGDRHGSQHGFALEGDRRRHHVHLGPDRRPPD